MSKELIDLLRSVTNEEDHKLKVEADLEVSDLQIGAVEIKDGTSDTRASVGSNGLAVSAKDNGSAWTPARTVTQSADATAGADASAAPTTGQKIVIDDIIISVDAAMSVTLEEETTGTDIAKFYMDAYQTLQITPRNGLKLATADKKVRIVTSAAGNISATLTYHSEA